MQVCMNETQRSILDIIPLIPQDAICLSWRQRATLGYGDLSDLHCILEPW